MARLMLGSLTMAERNGLILKPSKSIVPDSMRQIRTLPKHPAGGKAGRIGPRIFHHQQRRREEGNDPAAEAGPTVQALIKGTFGTDPRMPSPFGRGRGEARRFAFGRAAGNFSGLGVTGPSRNWKPSLSRPCSSLSTITRACPPAFK